MLSIIIPAYNVETYLERCLDSVLCQTYTDLEIILLNDGSEDGTGAICEAYAAKDKRIVYVDKENEGPAITRNRGIRMAKGEYLTFLDADDRVDECFAEYMLAAMRNSEVGNQSRIDMAICDLMYVDSVSGEGKISEIRMPAGLPWLVAEHKDLINRARTFLWGKVYRTESFLNCGIELPAGIVEDFPVVTVLVAQSERLVRVAKPLYYYYRNREGSLSSNYSDISQRYPGGVRVLCDNFRNAGLKEGFDKELFKQAYGQARFALQVVLRLQKQGKVSEGEYQQLEKELIDILRKEWPERALPFGKTFSVRAGEPEADKILEEALRLLVVSEGQIVDVKDCMDKKVNYLVSFADTQDEEDDNVAEKRIVFPVSMKYYGTTEKNTNDGEEGEILTEVGLYWMLADEILYRL